MFRRTRSPTSQEPPPKLFSSRWWLISSQRWKQKLTGKNHPYPDGKIKRWNTEHKTRNMSNMSFNIETSVFTKMVCCDASLSCAEGRMESSRGWTCDHRPLTTPSRTPAKSWTSMHSHKKTCPVTATTSTRKPSPETWSDSRVAFPVKTQIQQQWLKAQWSKLKVAMCMVAIFLTRLPWRTATSWSISGTAGAVFNRSLSLFQRNSSPETRSPQSHTPIKGYSGQTIHSFGSHIKCKINIYDINVLSSPLCDEAIVTTRLRNGWILGIFFLVRPDTMLISLIRLSSNRNTDSFSWSASKSCHYDHTGETELVFLRIFTFPSQQNRGHGFFLLILDDKTTSKCNSIFQSRHRFF